MREEEACSLTTKANHQETEWRKRNFQNTDSDQEFLLTKKKDWLIGCVINEVGSIKIKVPLIVDQVCRGTKQFQVMGLLFGFCTCANRPIKPVDSRQISDEDNFILAMQPTNGLDSRCDAVWRL